MMREVLKIDNKYLVLSLYFSNTKPRLWYTIENGGHKDYHLFSIVFCEHSEKKAWAVNITFLCFHCAFGFPLLNPKFNGKLF